jgi:hypothetical protein
MKKQDKFDDFLMNEADVEENEGFVDNIVRRRK